MRRNLCDFDLNVLFSVVNGKNDDNGQSVKTNLRIY